MKIVLLHDRVHDGSRPDEADVLVQAGAVSRALRELGHETVRLSFSLDLPRVVASLRDLVPDLVFNLVESVGGKGSLIHLAPALLDVSGIRYTGAPTGAMFATSNKILAKTLLHGRGIPTPRWFEADDTRVDEPAGGRFIVKSVWEHASVGLADDSIFEPGTVGGLTARLERDRKRLGGECFAEAYIDGREFNLSLLAGAAGPEVVAEAEIRFVNYADGKPKVVGYAAKWDEDSFEYGNTPRTFEFGPEDERLIARMRGIALDCWKLFGLRGYARVDYRVDGDGQPWVLEVNANPCLSPDAGFAAALEHAGIPFQAAMERIVSDSISPPFPKGAGGDSVYPSGRVLPGIPLNPPEEGGGPSTLRFLVEREWRPAFETIGVVNVPRPPCLR